MKIDCNIQEKIATIKLTECKIFKDRRHSNQPCKNKFEKCWYHAMDKNDFKLGFGRATFRLPGFTFNIEGLKYEDND